MLANYEEAIEHEIGHILMNYYVGWSISDSHVSTSTTKLEDIVFVSGFAYTNYIEVSPDLNSSQKDLERMIIRLLGGPISLMMYSTCKPFGIRRESNHKTREGNLLSLYTPKFLREYEIDMDIVDIDNLLSKVCTDNLTGFKFYSSLVYEVLVTDSFIRASNELKRIFYKEGSIFKHDLENVANHYNLEASSTYC